MARKAVWKNSIGHERLRRVLARAVEKETLGHAYLFCGDYGTGTVQVALEFAMMVLCGDPAAVACHSCGSCRKVLANAHPDFHAVFPVALRKEHRTSGNSLSPEGWHYLGEQVRGRIQDPWRVDAGTGTASIPVEWIRETMHAIQRGAIEAPRTVALIGGIDSLKRESANTMLKTLEEPPPDTVIVLLSEKPQAVLPTIFSRCQVLRFGLLSGEQLRTALGGRFGDSIEPARIDHAVEHAGGSLGHALGLIENDDHEAAGTARSLLNCCARRKWEELWRHVDGLTATRDRAAVERVIMYIAGEARRSGIEKAAAPGGTGAANRARLERLHRTAAACRDAVFSLRAQGNIQLTVVDFILSVTENMHEQKQQAG